MTDRPYGMFTPLEYQELIRRDADEMLALLGTVAPTAPVPGCPDWTVHDLVDHLGQVLQWVRLNAFRDRDATAASHPTTGPAEREPLADWYADCVDDLLKTLATTDPAQPCWTPQPGNELARFWWRRMSHELAMHRNDLAAAAGQEYQYGEGLAVDGIGEVLDVLVDFMRRRNGVTPLDLPAPLLIECTDGPERWLVWPVPGWPAGHEAVGPALLDSDVATAATAVLRGPAAGLLFAMWKRRDAAAAGLTLDGDTGVAERFLAATLTP